MYCYDLEVKSSSPVRVELGVRCTSVLVRTLTKILQVQVQFVYYSVNTYNDGDRKKLENNDCGNSNNIYTSDSNCSTEYKELLMRV